MNRSSRVIVVLAAVIIGIAFAFAATESASPVYVDDVYYWPEDDPLLKERQERAANARQVDAVTATPQEKSPKITFLDDSITRQNPDTVVRVRIKR